MTNLMSRPIWFVCDHETPCVYAADAVLALRADPPRCLAHGALLLSSTHHDGFTREQVLEDVKGEKIRPNISPELGQFEAGAMLRDRRSGAAREDLGDDADDACSDPGGHSWVCTGTAYGGDDERYFGEGRCYCQWCGADGDA